MPRNVLVSRPMAAPRRNIELKASDPDPERSLAVVLGLGARDRGSCASATPTSASTTGRLKLREEEPGGADADPVRPRRRRRGARVSRYRLIPIDDPRDAQSRAGGQPRHARRGREGTPPAAVAERPHPPRPRRRTSATSSSSRASPPRLRPRADELDRVTRLTEALEIPPERILRNSYSDQVVGSSALVDAARAVMERAHAPYSQLPRRRGAARRGRLDPRRRQRRERRLPAGPVRGGVRDRRADRGRPQAHHRGGGDLRRRRLLRAVRRLPPAAARVHRARARRSTCARATARARPRRSRRCCRAPSARSSCPVS